jgi:hypothetical protein
MIHAWTALLSAAFVVAACWGAGVVLVNWCGAKLNRLESAPLQFLTGACVLHLAIFAVMALKIAYKPVWLILIASAIAAGVSKNRKRAGVLAPKHWTFVLFSAIFLGYAVLFLVNAWVPETSADGSGYHLEIVSDYLRAHGFVQIATNMYSGLGQGIELLYAPAVAFGGFSAAALVHFAFLIALAWAIFAYGARIAKPWAGAVAALLVFLSPIVARDGASAYIDVATAAVVFAVFYWLEIWDGARDDRLLAPIGLLAGYAYAAKFTVAVIAIYALAFIAFRARRIRPLILTAACAALVIAPWMLKDWIYFHNPVAPFADEIFPNPYVHVVVEQQWTEWLRHYDLPKFQRLPGQVTLRGDYTQGIIGPAFLLAPLALLTLRRAWGWRVLLPGFVMLAVYFSNIGTRFLIPCLPFFALGIALAIENRWLLTILAVAHAVLSSPWAIPRYASKYVWRIETFPYRGALRITPEQTYLRENIFDYPVLRMINETIPPGERVFATGDLGWTAYSSREIIDHFRCAFGNTLWDIMNTGWAEVTQPSRLLVLHFPETEAARIRVVETAQAPKDQQWSVAELRFFDRGAEIARRPEWRLRAWPNPFEVQLAFDNSQATRWRTWQTAAPGMFLDTNFGRAEKIDEVRLETSPDLAWPIKLRVEKFDRGQWIALTGHFEERPNAVRNGIRRAASYELLRRGVHYVVVGDKDFGASDYDDDPGAWGLEEVARVPRATLFRILP